MGIRGFVVFRDFLGFLWVGERKLRFVVLDSFFEFELGLFFEKVRRGIK